MRKDLKIIIILAVALVILFLTFLFLPEKKNLANVCFKEYCFLTEVAKTQIEHKRGLMFRESLDKNRGMLFVFEIEGNYPFWMKNTLIPLDIIWINKNIEVVFIKKNAEPCKITECHLIDSNQNAKYALEINGGIAN